MADEDPEAPEELQESDHELSQIPDTPSIATNATKSPSKMSKLQSLVSTIMQNGSPSASHASTIMAQTPSASQASTIATHTPSATSKMIQQRDPSLSKETLKSQERTKKSQELSLNGKRTSLDQLSKEESDVGRKPRMHRRCQRRFRELIGKRELKKEELTKQQCVIKQRLDVLECSMPAVMVWNIWRMSQGTCVPNLKQVMEKQFQGPASGEVYCPSTPSRHFDCRVREVEAERKLAQKRADEARTLWAEKEAALEEKSKRLEEAKKTQIQIKENIEKLKVEAQKLREASKTVDDGACESGECRVIECKKKWLEKVPSGASIKSTDIECLEELQHLAQTELCMKRQIAELERREEAYMRTLQQADELWCKLQGDASSVTSALQDQLDVKTSANQRMADRIVQLEDAAEELRSRLATCRGQLEKFMSIDKIEALIGRDDDFADVLDKGIDVETLMSSKHTLVKPEAGEAGSQIGPDLADLATGVYYADLISMEDAGLGIRPEDFALEKQKIDEAREYLSAYRTLSELFTDDDYVCPNDFPCNDVVLTETGLTQEEMTALNEGRVTAETLLKEMQLEERPVAMTRMVRHMEQTFEETILEDGTVVADVMRYDDQITTESFATIDEREILVGEANTEIESVKDYASVVEGEIVEQTIIKAASYTSAQAAPDNILVPFNELVTWQDNVDTIRETVAKCPDCVVVKEGADAMAETMAKYTGRGIKEVIDEQPTIKREPADEIPEPEMIAEGIDEETMVVEEVAATEEVKYVEDFGEEMTQERIKIETATLSVTQEASEAAMPEVIPSFVEDEVSRLTEDLPPDEVAAPPFIEMASPVAEKEDYEEPRRPDEELITADAASAIVEEKSRTVVAEEIETVTISESTEVARVPREGTRRTETEEVEVLVEKTVEVTSISPDEEKVAEALSTRGRDEPDVVAKEMIREQEVPKSKEEETKSQIVPGKREESKPQVVAEKKDEEAVLEPIKEKEKEAELEPVPEKEKEVVLEVVPEGEEEAVSELVPKEEEEIVLELVPEGEEVVLELVSEEVEETALELVPGEVEEPVLEVVPEEAEEAVLEPVPETEEEIILEPVPEEEEEAVLEPAPEDEGKLAEEEETVTELPPEAEEEEIEVEMLPEVEEAEPEPTEEREIEVEVPVDEVEEETILPVDVLPEEEEAEIEKVPVVEEEAAVPVEEVPEVEILLAPLPEEVEGVPIEARIVSEVEVTIQVHVEEIRVLETPMSQITVLEDATPLPCICALPPEESEESDVSEVPEVPETPVPVTVYGVSYIHISASQRTILEIPKVPAAEMTQEFPCICCTMYQKEPVPEPPKTPDTKEVCELPCTCYLKPEEPVPEPRKTEETEEIYGPPCTCFIEPEIPDTRSRAPIPAKIQEAPCVCRSISEEPVIKTPKAPLEKRIREDPFDFSIKPEESVAKRSKTTIPEDPREVLSARFTKPDISEAPEPGEINKHPCVCSAPSEVSEVPEFPYVEGSVFLPFMYSIPDDEPEPTTKMEITQTEFIRNVEAMQVVTQTVSDAGTQTPLSKFAGPSPQPTRITVTRPADLDADIMSQISRRRRPATMMMMTATASTQTEKSSFLQVTQTGAKRTPSRRISDILRSLRAEVIHRRSDPEEELKSIDYGKKQPGTCKPVGKCNCCVCGKEMTESRVGSGRQSSTVFRVLPPVLATKVDSVPGVDQGVQQDAMCPRCKISKLHESLKSQESLKRSRKEPSRSTCDKKVCASFTSKSSAFSRQKTKIDQSVTAKIPRSRPKAEKPTKKDSEKTVQEIMAATKPVDKKSSHCICEMENGEPGSTSGMKCACGDPD